MNKFHRSIRQKAVDTFAAQDQLIFPEIQYDKIDKVRGMELTVVTSAKTDEEGRRLLKLLGMPFREN